MTIFPFLLMEVGDAYGTLHIGSYEFLACNKDVNILEDAAPPPPSACVFPRNRERSRRSRDIAYSSSVTGTVMTDDTHARHLREQTDGAADCLQHHGDE